MFWLESEIYLTSKTKWKLKPEKVREFSFWKDFPNQVSLIFHFYGLVGCEEQDSNPESTLGANQVEDPTSNPAKAETSEGPSIDRWIRNTTPDPHRLPREPWKTPILSLSKEGKSLFC